MCLSAPSHVRKVRGTETRHRINGPAQTLKSKVWLKRFAPGRLIGPSGPLTLSFLFNPRLGHDLEAKLVWIVLVSGRADKNVPNSQTFSPFSARLNGSIELFCVRALSLPNQGYDAGYACV